MVYKLHYTLITEFNNIFYEGLIRENDLVGELHLKKVSTPDGDEIEGFNFWGYLFEKAGKKYLLSDRQADGTEIDLSDCFPFHPGQCKKVSASGVVYHHIEKPKIFRIRPEQSMSFREMIDEFASAESSYPKHQILLWFIAFMSLYDKANIRVCSPPGMGKDGTIDIPGNLIGGCGTIENPSIAKLEERAYTLKWLAVNEVVGISNSQWKDIELFLLAVGADKPKITKRTRKFGNVDEIIDVSKFSLSLLYNDIDCYPDHNDYLDFFSKKAVLDRFVPMRLQGRLIENFDKIRFINVKKFVAENMDYYKGLVRNFLYYKEEYREHLHGYHSNQLMNFGSKKRWEANTHKLLKIVDLYCDTQDEFNEWVQVINESIQDYNDMLQYPKLIERIEKKQGEDVRDTTIKALQAMPTFTERKQYMERILRGGVPVSDKGVWDFESEIL